MLRLDILGVADQLVDQQINGGACELLADLLDLAGQHQPGGLADQAVDRDAIGPGLLDQHLATQQACFQAALEADVFKRAHPQRNAQQPPPEVGRLAALDRRHAAHVVGHQAEGAGRQALAITVGTLLVEQLQAARAQHRHQHQHGEHAAVDAQEDGVHEGGPRPSQRRLRRRTDSPCRARS